MKQKKLVAVAALLLIISASMSGQNFPSPQGYVSDYANVISQETESKITGIARAIEQATTAEVAVVTIPNLSPYGSIEEYSIELATDWGIGKEGKDNGMLLLLALEERKVRIEVGYGLEGAFTDGLTGRIRDKSLIPYFKNNDFGTGFLKAMEGIAGIMEDEYGVELAGVSQTESKKYSSVSVVSRVRSSPIYIIFVLIFVVGGRFLWPILFLGGFGRRGGRGGFGGFSGGGGGGGGGFGGFGGGGFGGGGSSGSF
jgi:uncharacterized protein